MNRLDEIAKRVKVFREIHEMNPKIQPMPYSETVGPDMEYLVDKLKTAIKYLREGKIKFTSRTTNSHVDDFLKEFE